MRNFLFGLLIGLSLASASVFAWDRDSLYPPLLRDREASSDDGRSEYGRYLRDDAKWGPDPYNRKPC